MTSTPAGSKRVLSNSSTPSPSTKYSQAVKKVKMPDVQSEFNLQLEESFESGSIQQHQVLAESDSTKSIVHCVMAAQTQPNR